MVYSTRFRLNRFAPTFFFVLLLFTKSLALSAQVAIQTTSPNEGFYLLETACIQLAVGSNERDKTNLVGKIDLFRARIGEQGKWTFTGQCILIAAPATGPHLPHRWPSDCRDPDGNSQPCSSEN